MTVRGTVCVKFDLTETAAGDLVTPTALLQKVIEYPFTDGAGAGQANLIFSDTRSLAGAANEDLDLAGVLVGALGGGPQTYARIKALWIRAAPTNTNNINVTRPATGVPLFLAASDGIALPPGAGFLLVAPTAAGIVVTPATADVINVAAVVAAATYDVVVLGAST